MSDWEQMVDSPAEEKDLTKTVVIAMDGSEYSDYALQFYVDCLHRPGNTVWLVHATEYKIVSNPAVALMSGSTDMTLVTKEIKAEEEKTAELIEKLQQRMSFLKIDANIQSIHGDVGPSIITFADEKNADFIVAGCRGKGMLRRTLTGSVTDYITHHSHMPVVIARNADHLEKLHLHMPFKQKKH
ncbi:uncharacterized protein LOC123565620 [Mercenaria mercenaria]|uniref:uncharacterized protein LOC123565620 n=1 Tax=Mercenaria mercenaria TaxID=6596 RepID=UPI00234FA03D|nr:uncharacterized protein LOC123565620 [Mercenaria mercenaria]